MLLISRVKKLWDNGITKKWFLIVIFVCITISFFQYYSSGIFHIYEDFFAWHSCSFIEKLEIMLMLSLLCFTIWLFGSSIFGFPIAYLSDTSTLHHYPIFTLMLCFYFFCSMLRCRNLKVNVLMALVPFYNPIALLFKKPRTQNNNNFSNHTPVCSLKSVV